MKTPRAIAAKLEQWADARDRINVRRNRKWDGEIRQHTAPPRLLDSQTLHDAAQYLRTIQPSSHAAPVTDAEVAAWLAEHHYPSRDRIVRMFLAARARYQERIVELEGLCLTPPRT